MTFGTPPRIRVSLVVVSHSAAVADGVAEIVAQVAGDELRIVRVGGSHGGVVGTDGAQVSTALEQASREAGDAAVVLMDFGSTVLNVKAALARLSPEQRARVVAVDAPLVEGALAAGMAAAQGLPVEAVAEAARGARHVPKL
jgi:PTS hybrid protein